MRTVIYIGLIGIHDAMVILAVSNGYVVTEPSEKVTAFMAIILLVVIAMDIVDFFRGSK